MNRRKKPKEPMQVELIPIYISSAEFADKKEEVQNLIARILVDYHKMEAITETLAVQFPPPSNLTNG